MPLASPIFCRFFKTIQDPLSEIPCPLGPNVNSWAVLGASTEPTFRVFVTCVGQLGRLGMPLAFPIFCRFFKTIQDPLSEIPCPLGPNVNSWAVLGASTESTFRVFVTCVGQVGRLGMSWALFLSFATCYEINIMPLCSFSIHKYNISALIQARTLLLSKNVHQ